MVDFLAQVPSGAPLLDLATLEADRLACALLANLRFQPVHCTRLGWGRLTIPLIDEDQFAGFAERGVHISRA